jgi:formamidopyrimidine-DNA glycosylase
MWCETSGAGRSSTTGPVLGLHLGMSGKIVVTDGRGGEVDGGDYWDRGRAPGDHRYQRFSMTFADGGRLILVDPRRLGRVRLDPPVERLGPDAAEITPAQLRAALARGTAPIKARLLDQEALAGVGNLLADQLLWQAHVNPSRPVNELSRSEVERIGRALRRTIAAAIAGGGVHTLPVVPYRKEGAACPRCGAPMVRSVVGSRTTWRCSREQE